jgi:DNA invertase Pin-like site-specific DNA recombinase
MEGKAEMSELKRVIEVLRISTDAQDLQRQRDDLERNRAAHGLTVARVVELEGVSGRKVLGNAEMQLVLRDLKDPAIAGISISALDRLFRMERYSDYSILDPFKDTGKTIWSCKEGALDLRTDAGLIISLMSGAQGALEWRELRRRTAGGKELLRTRGGAPDGPMTLPRGVGYEPVKDAKGRSIGARWFYEAPDCDRIRKAYDLLFERRSWLDIAERIGGGFSDNGVKSSLTNPIWKGYRRYMEGRDEPLEIQVIDEPLISAARWEAAQEIILQKRSRWAKTRRAPHVLLSGLLRCGRCGEAVYVRVGGSSRRSYYYCSTGHPNRSASCGAGSVQQDSADREMERIVSTELLDASFLRTIFGRFQFAQPARDQNADKLDRQREALEKERQQLLRMTLKGACSEDDFARESKRLEGEMRDLDRLAPAPVPAAIDPKMLIVGITRAFARFAKQPFAEKHALLRTVFRDFALDNGNVTGFTLNGGFLDNANSPPRCSPSSIACC